MMEERASLWLMVVAASAHWMAVGATKLERNSMGHRWRNLQEEGGKCFECSDVIEIHRSISYHKYDWSFHWQKVITISYQQNKTLCN